MKDITDSEVTLAEQLIGREVTKIEFWLVRKMTSVAGTLEQDGMQRQPMTSQERLKWIHGEARKILETLSGGPA